MAEADQLVYHYCSLETFAAILESKVLRLCEIDKSNDSKELLWFREFVENAVVEQYKEDYQGSLPPVQLAQNAERILGMLGQGFDHCFTRADRMNFLVACFSAAPDLLSQWRAYSQDGAGVSIGFSKQALAGQAETLGERVREVYTKSTKVSGWRAHGEIQYLDRATGYQTTKRNLNNLGWIKDNARRLFKVIDSPDAFSKATSTLAYNALMHAPYFKNAGFQEEQEWRVGTMVCHMTAPFEPGDEYHAHLQTLVPRQYFIRSGSVVYYKEMPFPAQAIRSVYIGPKCGATPYDLFVLARLNGIPLDIGDVYPSSVSYR